MSAPGIDNSRKLFKADLTSDYLSGGTYGRGLLPEAVSDSFIVAMQAKSIFLQEANVQRMTSMKQDIDVAGFGSRVLFKDVAGVAPTDAQRSSLTISRNQLDAVWMRAATELNYHVQNENIMKLGIGAYVKSRLVDEVYLDIEETCWYGDTDSAVDGLDAFDGIIKKARARGRVIDSTDVPSTITDEPFLKAYLSLPKAWRARNNKPDLRFYCSDDVEAVYANWLTHNRNLAQAVYYDNADPGDRIKLQGVFVKPMAMLANDVIICTNRMNICPGFFIEMFLEEKHDPAPGTDAYYLRLAMDVELAQDSGIAIFEGLDLEMEGTL